MFAIFRHSMTVQSKRHGTKTNEARQTRFWAEFEAPKKKPFKTSSTAQIPNPVLIFLCGFRANPNP
jgi:hypothetical protein